MIDKAEQEVKQTPKIMKQFRLSPATIMTIEELGRKLGLNQTQVVEKAIYALRDREA